jgi:hypothetical protein
VREGAANIANLAKITRDRQCIQSTSYRLAAIDLIICVYHAGIAT